MAAVGRSARRRDRAGSTRGRNDRAGPFNPAAGGAGDAVQLPHGPPGSPRHPPAWPRPWRLSGAAPAARMFSSPRFVTGFDFVMCLFPSPSRTGALEAYREHRSSERGKPVTPRCGLGTEKQAFASKCCADVHHPAGTPHRAAVLRFQPPCPVCTKSFLSQTPKTFPRSPSHCRSWFIALVMRF